MINDADDLCNSNYVTEIMNSWNKKQSALFI